MTTIVSNIDLADEDMVSAMKLSAEGEALPRVPPQEQDTVIMYKDISSVSFCVPRRAV